METLSLSDMLRGLREVDDMTWGRYAFSRDLLRDRVPASRRDEMIGRAVECGKQWAARIIKDVRTSRPATVGEYLGLSITEVNLPVSEKWASFAQFAPDKRIEIASQPLYAYTEIYQIITAEGDDAALPHPDTVLALLIAHEIFHYVEDRHSDEIYTRTETIRLWKIFCFKNDSTIRALGEIAAMSYAKALTGVDFNPFMLHILLFYGIKAESAESIYKEVMGLYHG